MNLLNKVAPVAVLVIAGLVLLVGILFGLKFGKTFIGCVKYQAACDQAVVKVDQNYGETVKGIGELKP